MVAGQDYYKTNYTTEGLKACPGPKPESLLSGKGPLLCAESSLMVRGVSPSCEVVGVVASSPSIPSVTTVIKPSCIRKILLSVMSSLNLDSLLSLINS